MEHKRCYTLFHFRDGDESGSLRLPTDRRIYYEEWGQACDSCRASLCDERIGCRNIAVSNRLDPISSIFPLIVSLALNWKDRTRRKLIAIPLAVYVLALLVTAMYFVPELQNFPNSPTMNVSPAEWHARGQRWQILSWTRGLFLALSYIPLPFALRSRDRESPRMD
jgi:hypothetical protein